MGSTYALHHVSQCKEVGNREMRPMGGKARHLKFLPGNSHVGASFDVCRSSITAYITGIYAHQAPLTIYICVGNICRCCILSRKEQCRSRAAEMAIHATRKKAAKSVHKRSHGSYPEDDINETWDDGTKNSQQPC